MTGQQFTLEHSYVAGIDIGTNTILMSIAKIIDNNIEIIQDHHSIARLGEGVDKTGVINENAINRALDILKDYRNELDYYQNVKIIPVGTSALRDAKNRVDVINLLSKTIGAKINIISGEIEAGLSYIGAINSLKKCLMIDIGGGSTEISVGNQGKISSRNSFNFGSVRITEKFFKNHPPLEKEIEIAKSFIEDIMLDFRLPEEIDEIYGVAGTMTSIAAINLNLNEFSKESIHNKIISIEEIKTVFQKLLNSSLEEITTKYHVNPKRADVITAGVLIALTVSEKLNLEKITISSDGLRTGIIKNSIMNLYTL